MRNFLSLFLIAAGLLAIIIGVLIRNRALDWFGHLPGDIRYASGSVRIFFPITSMVIVSIVLSAIIWVARRWW